MTTKSRIEPAWVPLAALPHRRDDGVDLLLEEAARMMQSAGLEVIGYVQRKEEIPGQYDPDRHLEDVTTGERIVISQSLGSGSRACRLDPQGLTDATQRMLTKMESGADVLILNRFGHGELEGGGFRSVIERAVSDDMPALIAVG